MTGAADDEIEEAVRAADWAANGADPRRTAAALEHLRRAQSEQEAAGAYNDVLDAHSP